MGISVPDGRTVTRWDVFCCWLLGHRYRSVRFYTGQYLRRCERCGAWRA